MTPLDEEGHFINKNVSGRYREETQEYERTMFDYMDVSPKMVFSVATALIPFLQNDDANRALMGSNMQRQAVPLLTTEAPVVGTGMEAKAAVDSGVCVVAKKDGVIERSTSKEITMKNDDGTRDEIPSDQVFTKQPEQLLQPEAYCIQGRPGRRKAMSLQTVLPPATARSHLERTR